MASLGNTIINGILRVNGKVYVGESVTAPSFIGDLAGNADSATALETARTIDGVDFDGSAAISHYGTCSTAAATAIKEVACDGFKLVTGAMIAVRFTVTNTAAVANLKLNVNSTGDIAIKYRNANLPAAGDLAANRTYAFVYDGNYWQWIGDRNSDADTYDRIIYKVSIKAGATAIVKSNLIVASPTDGTYTHLKLGNAFDITSPILWADAAISAGATGTNTYIAIPMTITTTQSLTLTIYEPLFIKGTLNGTVFTPVSTTPLTQTIPTEEDNFQYIYLGRAYSTTAFYLEPYHPVYEFINGKFMRQGSGIKVPEYTIIETTTTQGYAKTYSLTKDNVETGVKINIPKDLVVSAGEVKTVTTADVPYTGAVVGDKYIDLTLNDATQNHIYIPVKDLVDVYTGVDGAKVTVSINGSNQISATIKAGTIALTDLVSTLQTKIGEIDNKSTATNILNGSAAGSVRTINTEVESSSYTIGENAFAEGADTRASGEKSHAEGYRTEASGIASHAEGYYTDAGGDYQHVQGKYNVVDISNRYAHIVGNGDSDGSRSNAYTLDWNGNAWYQGVIKVGGTSYDDGSLLIPSSNSSITNFVIMTNEQYTSQAENLSSGTVVLLKEESEMYTTTQATGLTCELPLNL